MGVPYEAPPMVGIVANGGSQITVSVPFPPRGYVNKLVVQQTDGVQENFIVELFNHRDALDANDPTSASDSSPADGSGSVPLRLHRVSPPIPSDTAGLLEYFSEVRQGGSGFMFCNMDPSGNNRKVDRLYLRITPDGAGDKVFAVAIGGESALD